MNRITEKIQVGKNNKTLKPEYFLKKFESKAKKGSATAQCKTITIAEKIISIAMAEDFVIHSLLKSELIINVRNTIIKKTTIEGRSTFFV